MNSITANIEIEIVVQFNLAIEVLIPNGFLKKLTETETETPGATTHLMFLLQVLSSATKTKLCSDLLFKQYPLLIKLVNILVYSDKIPNNRFNYIINMFSNKFGIFKLLNLMLNIIFSYCVYYLVGLKVRMFTDLGSSRVNRIVVKALSFSCISSNYILRLFF